MKKICFAVLIIMSLALSACGNGNNTYVLAADFMADPGGPMELIDWMDTGTFGFDFRVITTIDGSVMEEKTGSMAVKDNMVYISLNDTDGNRDNITSIIKNGIVYDVNDRFETVSAMPFIKEISTGGLVINYGGIEFTNSGTGEIDGKTLPYDEYSKNDDTTVRFYIENGRIFGIESIAWTPQCDVPLPHITNILIIANASGNIPDKIFELPYGYAVYNMMEMININRQE